MSGPKFFETPMGRSFFSRDVPALIRNLDKLVKALAPRGFEAEDDHEKHWKQQWALQSRADREAVVALLREHSDQRGSLCAAQLLEILGEDYVVICRVDTKDDGSPGNYVQASSRTFSRDEAEAYAKTIAPGRDAVVVRVSARRRDV